MPIINEKEKLAWQNAISKKLEKCIQDNELDIVVDYGDVSKAFPSGPHPDYFGFNAIDFGTLKTWANKNGWNVKTAPECTHPDQQTIPRIRFTKIGYVRAE